MGCIIVPTMVNGLNAVEIRRKTNNWLIKIIFWGKINQGFLTKGIYINIYIAWEWTDLVPLKAKNGTIPCHVETAKVIGKLKYCSWILVFVVWAEVLYSVDPSRIDWCQL